MKHILLLLSCLMISFSAFAQIKNPEYRNIKCDSLLKYDTIQVGENNYKYKIVSLYREIKKTDTIYIGNMILPEFSPNSDKKYLNKILSIIGEKEKFSGFQIYHSCESMNMLYSSSFTSYTLIERIKNYKKDIGKVLINN